MARGNHSLCWQSWRMAMRQNGRRFSFLMGVALLLGLASSEAFADKKGFLGIGDDRPGVFGIGDNRPGVFGIGDRKPGAFGIGENPKRCHWHSWRDSKGRLHRTRHCRRHR